MKTYWQLILIALLAAGCGPTAPAAAAEAGAQVWLDAPLDGAHLPLQPVQIVVSSSASDAPEEFVLQVNGAEVAVVPAAYTAGEGETYAYAVYEWNPPAPGSYLLAAAAGGSLAEAHVTICAEGETALADACAAAGAAEEATLEATSTPAGDVLVAVPSVNANCRFGPSQANFEIADTLFAGIEYKPIARGPDNLWVLFAGPSDGRRCWVVTSALELFLNEALVEISEVPLELLPVVQYPAMPTATPTATVTPEPYTPQCSDGLDNEGDRFTDLRDAQCSGPNDNDEAN